MTLPKEPKYWLCDDAPPPDWRGPGDAHSQQEWVWRRDDYDGSSTPPRPGSVRGESTPFYLWSRGAHRRIGEQLPEVRLIAVVRDPIDRAYSNWMHLWSDGLEPEADFERRSPCSTSGSRRAGRRSGATASSGCTASSSSTSTSYVDPQRVLVLRYRAIVDDPPAAVDRACRFLGIRRARSPRSRATTPATSSSPAGARPPRAGGPRRRLARPVRAAAGLAPGQRAAGRAAAVRRAEAHRRTSTPERAAAAAGASPRTSTCSSEITGEDFGDWLSDREPRARSASAAGRDGAVSGRA